MPTEPSQETEQAPKVTRKHPKAECEHCPWYARSKYAGESGPDGASILVVGEAPGRVEATTGVPFTGPSGKLLDRVLAHHGLDRDAIRFTNVAACHPPYTGNQKSEAPPKDVVLSCAPRLRVELEGRDVVVALGNTAKEAILGTREAITKVRQGPPRTLPGGTAAVIATIHPAACLRSGDSFPSLVRDIGKIKRLDEFETWEPPKWRSYEDANDALLVLNHLSTTGSDSDGDCITVDIECGVDKDESFTHPSQLLCVGIGYEPGKAVVIGEKALLDRRVLAALRTLLSRRKVVCHNGKYDLQVLMRLGILSAPGLYADTMLASYVLDERGGQHGLKGLATEVLGAPDYASELKKYVGPRDSYAIVPRPILYEYNAYDAALTYTLWVSHFELRLEEAGLRGLHDRLVGYSNEMVYLELDGVRVDQDYLAKLEAEYLEILDGMEKQLQELVLGFSNKPGFNPRSWQQVKAALLALGVHAPDTTADTLQALFERSKEGSDRYRFLDMMLTHRKEAKAYGTYVKGVRIRLHEGRVFPTYLLHGTTSGRTSCRNPNVQNVTRGSKLRRMYVPEAGNTFVQADYAQAELRVIACESKDEYLQEVLSDPSRDFLGEITERFKGPNWTKEDRVRGKAIVYGLAYGREAPSIAAEYGLSRQEVEDFIREYFKTVPQVAKWRQDVRDQVFKKGQSLQTHFGRKRRFWLITRDNKMDVEKEALSYYPQSIANDICLTALVILRRSFGNGSSRPRIRIPVHDSILVECQRQDRDKVAAHMKAVMEGAARDHYSDFVPFPVDVSYGDTWGDLDDAE